MSWKSSLRKLKSKTFGNKGKHNAVTDTMYLYTEAELDQYESFIKEQFGEYDLVFHEIYSPDIHLDVILVPPTEKSNYYKLVTMGMGAYAMHVPDELKAEQLEHAELVFYLPPTWNIKSDREEDYWPIAKMKAVARVPVQYDTWLGYGHTFSDEKKTPFAGNTDLCGLMLLQGTNNAFDPLELNLGEKGKINFYQLFPLYKEELDYKLAYGVDALLELFSDEDIMPILNINRKNYGAPIALAEGFSLRSQADELSICSENNIAEFLQAMFENPEEFVVLSSHENPDDYIQAVQAKQGIEVQFPIDGVLSTKICTREECTQMFMDFFNGQLEIDKTEFKALEWA